MSTIAEKLALLMNTKAEIKKAIEEKDVTVGDIPFSKYPDLIKNITTTGQYYLYTEENRKLFTYLSFQKQPFSTTMSFTTNGTLKVEVVHQKEDRDWLNVVVDIENKTLNFLFDQNGVDAITSRNRSAMVVLTLEEEEHTKWPILITQLGGGEQTG